MDFLCYFVFYMANGTIIISILVFFLIYWHKNLTICWVFHHFGPVIQDISLKSYKMRHYGIVNLLLR